MEQELKDALRLISKVQSDPRLESDQREQLRRAERELYSEGRSGKPDRQRLFRAVERVATVLQQVVKNGEL